MISRSPSSPRGRTRLGSPGLRRDGGGTTSPPLRRRPPHRTRRPATAPGGRSSRSCSLPSAAPRPRCSRHPSRPEPAPSGAPPIVPSLAGLAGAPRASAAVTLPGSATYGNCGRNSTSLASTLSPAASASTSVPVCAAPSSGLQRDVDDVVAEPAAVREALQVPAEHAEPVRLRGRLDRRVQPQHLRGLDHVLVGVQDVAVQVGLDRARRAVERRRTFAIPVRKISTRSLRGPRRRRHAVDPLDQLGQLGVGDPGDDRGDRGVLVRVSAPLKASLRPAGSTTSLTSGLPRRDTCTGSPVRVALPGASCIE